jgi:hypothetical protein
MVLGVLLDNEGAFDRTYFHIITQAAERHGQNNDSVGMKFEDVHGQRMPP